jgi:hypothetical protein
MVTERADGEELADLVWVLAQVRCCQEDDSVSNEHAATAVAAGRGVEAVERGQLPDLLAVEQKDLAHETAGSIGVHGGPVGIETRDGMRLRTGEAELGNDVRPGPHHDRREGRSFQFDDQAGIGEQHVPRGGWASSGAVVADQ